MITRAYACLRVLTFVHALPENCGEPPAHLTLPVFYLDRVHLAIHALHSHGVRQNDDCQ